MNDQCLSIINNDEIDEFDYETYFYNANSSSSGIDPTRNDFIAYIDRFRLTSPRGQLRARFNLELKFFMNLKSLRLDYMNSLNMMKKQQQTTSNKPEHNTHDNNLVESSSTTSSQSSASFASSLSKIPQLQLGGASNRNINEIRRSKEVVRREVVNNHRHRPGVRKSFLPVRINAVTYSTNPSHSPSSLSSFSPSSSSSSNLDAVNSQNSNGNQFIKVI